MSLYGAFLASRRGAKEWTKPDPRTAALAESRSNWPQHYSPLEAKAWIAAHDAILAALPADWCGHKAVVHAARDVDGLWWPQDDNFTGTDLTFWGPEAGEALRDLRTAVCALDDRERAALEEKP